MIGQHEDAALGILATALTVHAAPAALPVIAPPVMAKNARRSMMQPP